MVRNVAIGNAITTLLASTASAETIDIRMLNNTADGEHMVFDPAFVQVQPGDVVRFLATVKGHNAETIDGLILDGATGLQGRINEEIKITFDAEGVYGVMCKPHYAMGMVMTIAVSANKAPDGFLQGWVPKRVRDRSGQAI